MAEKTVVSIGEILWDVFPDGKKAGGSAMNVALNLHKQGIASKLISAVGADENGNELIGILQSKNFDTALIQVNSLPTSTVEVKLDKNKYATYTIVEPVAWDRILLTTTAIDAVANADAFVYCSLTCRNEKSKNTILNLIEHAKLKVFDINLRPPFYTIETLQQLLAKADLLKVNEHELAYLQDALQLIANSDEQLLRQLAQQFNIQMICLTLGERGAYALYDNQLHHHPGYVIKVADTVGAGDAFLATFVANYLKGYPITAILNSACKIGAFVASQKGANPNYGNAIDLFTD